VQVAYLETLKHKALFFALFIAVNSVAQVSNVEGVTPLEGVQIVRPSNVTNEAQREDKFWDDTKTIGNREAFEAYLNVYPKGRYVTLAKANLAQLKANNPPPKKTEDSDLGLKIFRIFLDEMINSKD
jgi:hypothetical protein